MNRRSKHLVSVLIVIAVFSFSIYGVKVALAQGDYEISWWTVDGGGDESVGEGYTLIGTIGQHDAGFLGGGDFSLHGGFWVKGILESIVEYIVNLPLILR